MNDKSQIWFRKLVKAQPAVYWPWRHSLRLMLITTVPLTIGFMYGNLVAPLFVCLGGLLSAISVQTDPYRDRFHRIFIAVPFGMSGFVIGSFIGGQGLVTIVGVVLVALVSGWVSFWGKTFSAGALQMLIMTVVASHAPHSAMTIFMPLLFALGAIYAAVLLGIEALFLPKQPERKLTSLLFSSLADLARSAAENPADSLELKAALHDAIEAQANAYSVVMLAKSHKVDGEEDAEAGKKILAMADRLTVLLATQKGDADSLRQAAATLDILAKLILKQKTPSVVITDGQDDSELTATVAQLVSIAESPLIFTSTSQTPSLRTLTKELGGLSEAGLRAQFEVQRSNLINILSLALCMFIAMLAEFHLHGNRSYWIPLSVAVILKPDFGSVFVRAVQRSAGTLIGVLIAVLIFYAVPKGLWLVAVVGLLSAIIPWASLKNYAWQCTFLTPLILILIDLIIAGPTIDYGPQRLLDTLLGALIVLVFGYFIWPKPVKVSFAARYTKVMKAISAYIDTLSSGKVVSNAFDASVDKRHNAYVEIFGLRKWTQSFLAEPPPVSNEAHAWLPRIDEAEQLVDRIGDYMISCETTHKAADDTVLEAFRDEAKSFAPAHHTRHKPV